MCDLRYKRVPRPPRLVRLRSIILRVVKGLYINSRRGSKIFPRKHLWAKRLRCPVMCSRRKGCGDPCMYPDYAYTRRSV